MSVPAKVMVPLRARGLPKMVIISVDLPAPLAPISATISPSLTDDRDAVQRADVAVICLDALDLKQRFAGHYLAILCACLPQARLAAAR